ncbi:MAG: rubrerythrin family protein [Myxococcales bacterium]|nr:rubrerythrin family protein [Myxococcales bacterium]
MDERIRQAHHEVYAGEAKAALRLRYYAATADKEGFPQVAHLFRAIARSEEIHGERAMRALGMAKDTQTNLEAAFESESKVAGVAYDRLLQLAHEAGDKAAETVFSQARDVEAVHARLYRDALQRMTEERETTYFVCPVCGYVSDGSRPERCPVCNVPGDRFEEL